MPKVQIDFSKTIIYKIVHKEDPDNHDTYVGHTTEFTKRKSSHKRRCENPNNTKHHLKVYQYIRENGGWDNFIMLEIEKYPCNDANEARAREQEWYTELKSKLNKICPKRSYKEWYDENREEVQKKNKEWLNKDDNRNKMLKYYNDRYYEKKYDDFSIIMYNKIIDDNNHEELYKIEDIIQTKVHTSPEILADHAKKVVGQNEHWKINNLNGVILTGNSQNDYWSKQTNQIVTFEKLMYDYGSPGKVFQLDEKSMEEYLEKLENEGKNFVFNRGAGGLRQITKVKKISEVQLLKNCYKRVA